MSRVTGAWPAGLAAARRATRQRGISLLDMTLVVVLLGVLAAALVPGLEGDDPARLALAADEAAAALRFARAESLRSGEPHGVRVRNSPRSLDVFRLDTSGGNPVEVYDVYHPLSKRPYTQPLAGEPFPPGVSMSADFRYAAAAAATSAVAFSARGEPVSPVDLAPLYQTGSLLVGVRGATVMVLLATVTGRVSLQ